jgi:hypothetical protein
MNIRPCRHRQSSPSTRNQSRPLGRRFFLARIGLLLVLCGVVAACGRPEDPARVQLRERLTQKPQLSNEELTRVRDEVGKAIAGRKVRLKEDGAARDLNEEQRAVILGMLAEPAGLFDEGLRQEANGTVRILNAPGESLNPEIEASRKLWIDIQTFQPRRFEFAYAFPGNGDYAFDLVVE